MRFRKLSRTDALVSVISLGTVEIGMDYGLALSCRAQRPIETDAANLLHRDLTELESATPFAEAARLPGDIINSIRTVQIDNRSLLNPGTRGVA